MEQILLVCGTITAIGGAAAVVVKAIIKPLQKISKDIEQLERVSEG